MPGISQNASWTVGDFAQHLGLPFFQEMWFVPLLFINSFNLWVPSYFDFYYSKLERNIFSHSVQIYVQPLISALSIVRTLDQ